MTGQSPVVNYVLWPFGYRLGRDSERFHYEVLEDSIRNGTDTLKDRDQLLSYLLSFLKIVTNSILA